MKHFIRVAALGLLAATAAICAPGGKLLYLGAWPHHVVVFDSDSEKIVDRIDLKTDIPRTLTLSTDNKQLFAYTLNDSAIVTVDLATDSVVNSFSLNSGNRKVRLSGLVPDPSDKLLYAVATTVISQPDRYEIEPPKFAVIDLAAKKIVRTVDFPKEEGSLGYRVTARISPDGKFLYLFRDSVLIFDTATLKLIKKIDLSKPDIAEMENLSLNMVEDPNETPGKLTGFFNSSDPYVHREVFGIAEFDLRSTTFNFTPVGPATATNMMPLLLTPDRRVGYTVAVNGTHGNRRCEFLAFDMASHQITGRREFDGRTRFFFGASADGEKLFVYGAGYQIEVYDAKTFALRNTIDFPGDITTNMVVMPLSAQTKAAHLGSTVHVAAN